MPAPAKTIVVRAADKSTSTSLKPEYDALIAIDQQVLGYLLNSLSKVVLTPVCSITNSQALWTALGNMFSLEFRSLVSNVLMQLSNVTKGNQSVAA